MTQDTNRAALDSTRVTSATSADLSAHHDVAYAEWRTGHVARLDDDYAAWKASGETVFPEDFDAWRRNRVHTESSMVGLPLVEADEDAAQPVKTSLHFERS